MVEEILADFFDSNWIEAQHLRFCEIFNRNKSRRDLHIHSSFLTPHSSLF